MSDPKQHHDQDDLDLDAETVRDLEPDGDDVRGGMAAAPTRAMNCTASCDGTCVACRPS